ncbi:hypothetical protein F5I97DRAFT_1938425 [Phlebopus sp. FC_14]|nr:hypothetical protein F5I97DRAFT_1938425 [Phlebopus sp. FC_14]
MNFVWLCLSSILVGVVACLDLDGCIQWNEICPNYQALGPARVLLDTGRYSARVTRSGNFSIPDVGAGTYILSVLSHDYAFEQMRVDVSNSSPTPEIKSYIVGTPLMSPSVVLSYPVVFTPRHKNNYFQPRESFNLLGMFRNPMMMIMVLTGVLVVGMPYIMKNLDPQTLEELQGQQAKVASLQNSVPNGSLTSGLSPLLAAEEESKPLKSSANGSTVQQRRAGRNNKRR